VFIAKLLTSFKTVRHCEVPRVLDSCEIRRSHSGISAYSSLLLQPLFAESVPPFKFSSRHLGTVKASRFFDILIKVSALIEKVSRRSFGTDARRAVRFVVISVIAEVWWVGSWRK
jgi:hypothetical protein